MQTLGRVFLCILLLCGTYTFVHAQLVTYDGNSSAVKAAQRGNEFFNASDYESAIAAYGEYIEILKNPKEARNNIEYAFVLFRMGVCSRLLKLYDQSVGYLLQADSIYATVNPMIDAFKCQLSDQLSYSMYLCRDIDGAEQWGKKTLIQCRRYYKNMSQQTADAHFSLYIIYCVKGDVVQSSIHLQQYIDICRYIDNFDPGDIDNIKHLISLGSLYNQLNKCEEGVKILSEADSLLAEINPYHPYRLSVHNHLFSLYQASNDRENAEYYIGQAAVLAENMEAATDEEFTILMNYYNNVAVYLQEEDAELALEIMDGIVKHYEEKGNTKSLNYALSLTNYAAFLEVGSVERLKLLRRATDILTQLRSVDVTLLIQLFTAYINEMIIYEGKYNDEITRCADVLQSYLGKRLDQSFSFLAEGERVQYWNQVRSWYQYFLPILAYRVGTPQMLTICYNGLLQSRGILLSSTISIEQLVHNSDDPVLKGLLAQMKELQTQQNPGLGRAVEALEQRILSTLPQYGNFMDMLNITIDSVGCSLKAGDAAIEFMKVPSEEVDTEDACKYVALVMKKGYTAPHIIELCHGGDLKNDTDHDLYYRKVWKPLSEELGGIKRIFFSPDGRLFSLPIEYSIMPTKQSIMDKYACYRVSSTREIVRKKAQTGVDAALYGGIRYDMSVEDMVADADKYRIVTAENVRERGRRGAVSGIQYLPGTLTEANEIAQVINSSSLTQASLYTGSEATEASFKALSSQYKRIIHIATHGFFESDNNNTINIVEQEGNVFAEEAALACSGLLFAGVDNIRFCEPIPDGVEDGVMNAAEISHLDLHGTELVVLSACQTAQGIITGDGVFGLQRGFKKAGANSILMSLWKVDDEATCLLMTEFYKNWIGKKMTKYAALEAAKKSVQSRKEKGWDDPKYWAAFILLDALD
ncbi:MAG: CHAT domain-containing protein [Bacteroidaceae bacterium]|nr:CHAT domain-containing protein [Bacteroidaceae bacterium]